MLADSEGSGEAATPNSFFNESQQVTASQDAGAPRVAPMLASGLFGSPVGIISSDVALDSAEPVVGSFTADGMTYALSDGEATLVAVSSDLQQVTDLQDADDSHVAPMLASGQVAVPASVAYGGVTYPVTTIGPYAFYLSGATDVALPATISSVDDRALRSSDVERVEVDAGNPDFASFDGCLYDSQLTRLLLIPGGRQGAVRIASSAEGVDASAFSHCAGVDAVSVDAGSAAHASWDGLLYDASGQTLLRVPAGATEIAIRDGCTTIAAGALEGCAKLERITAPASITSISPDVSTSVPTVSLPAQSALQDGSQDDPVAGPLAGPGYEGDARSASADSPAEGESGDSTEAEGEAEVSPRRVVASSQGLEAPLALPDLGSTSASPSSEASSSAPQLTAMVALSTTDDDLPEVDPSEITVSVIEQNKGCIWQERGFNVMLGSEGENTAPAPAASLETAQTYSAYPSKLYSNGHKVKWTQQIHLPNGTYQYDASGYLRGDAGAYLENNTEVEFYHILETDSNPGSRTQMLRWNFGNRGNTSVIRYFTDFTSGEAGWSIKGFGTSAAATEGIPPAQNVNRASTFYAIWRAHTYTVAFDSAGGTPVAGISATYDKELTLSEPNRQGYAFCGWKQEGTERVYPAGNVKNLTTDDKATVKLVAQWQSCEISFDVDSEPGDADYPGKPKDSISAPDAVGPDGTIPIEDPKRPGYVFEGWVIPNGDGTEAVDQDLVYQDETDGKWYVDASKLPDYAGDDGRVELTARWTSIISVDVPSSVTFYADLVTQGQESREGAASSAFGQSKVSNQSQVDLRVVGLESSAVKTEGSTLGADSILKKADAATPSTSTQKLLSLYPSTKQWKPEDLQNPDAVGGSKAATAVDFDLDDILLEKSFSADDFTIAAGSTLNMGYRLNLSETGQQLDYDKLSTLEEGQSASIANVSYCFATNGFYPAGTGTTNDDIYIVDGDTVFGPSDIKQSATSIARNGTKAPAYSLFKRFLDSGMDPDDPSDPKGYVRWGDGQTYSMRIIGINEDYVDEAATVSAGLTFQFIDILPVVSRYNSANTNQGGWEASELRARMNPDKQSVASGEDDDGIWQQVRPGLAELIQPVYKWTHNDYGTTSAEPTSTVDHLWLISNSELVTPGTQLSSWADYPWIAREGAAAPYSYWQSQAVSGSIENQASLFQYRNGRRYWSYLRSTTPGSWSYCLIINSSGGAFANNTTNGVLDRAGGIRPCFCL